MIRVRVLRDGELVCFRDCPSSQIARDYEQRMAKMGYGTARDNLDRPTERPSKPSKSQAGNSHRVRPSNATSWRSGTSPGT